MVPKLWPNFTIMHHLHGLINCVSLKVHGPIFQNSFCISFKGSSHQRCKFQISVKSVKPFGCWKQFCILQLPISYCVSLIMVTITGHVFINFFQTDHFLALKFYMSYEKNMSFLVIQKSPKV